MIRQISPNFTSKFTIYRTPGAPEKYFQNIRKFAADNNINYTEVKGSLGNTIELDVPDELDSRLHSILYFNDLSCANECKKEDK